MNHLTSEGERVGDLVQARVFLPFHGLDFFSRKVCMRDILSYNMLFFRLTERA